MSKSLILFGPDDEKPSGCKVKLSSKKNVVFVNGGKLTLKPVCTLTPDDTTTVEIWHAGTFTTNTPREKIFNVPLSQNIIVYPVIFTFNKPTTPTQLKKLLQSYNTHIEDDDDGANILSDDDDNVYYDESGEDMSEDDLVDDLDSEEEDDEDDLVEDEDVLDDDDEDEEDDNSDEDEAGDDDDNDEEFYISH